MNNKVLTHSNMRIAYLSSLMYISILGYTPEVFKNMTDGKWVYEILIPNNV
jgi:hypothetical protein